MEAFETVYDIPGDDFTRAGEASSAIKNTLKQMGLPAELVRNVAIAVYEGEINMHIHANGGNIRLAVDETSITVTLTDTGKGIPDIEKAMQEGYTTAPESVRSLGFGAGMGLPNMKKYSDSIDVQSVVDKGTVVTLTFAL